MSIKKASAGSGRIITVEGHKALEELSDAYATMAESQVDHPRAPVEEYVESMNRSASALEEDQPAFRALLASDQLTVKDANDLKKRTRAYLCAHIDLMTETDAAAIEPNAEEILALYKRMHRTVKYLCAEDESALAKVAALPTARGVRMTSFALIGLVQIIGPMWKTLEPRWVDHPEDIERAQKLALELMESFKDEETAHERLVDLRNRAFTYARELHLEIIAAANYVWRNDPAKLARYATYVKARRAAPRADSDVSEEVVVPTPPLMIPAVTSPATPAHG